MSKKPEANDTARALRRLALLYRHFAETLDAELGREKAEALITKAMYAYGAQIGREALARARKAGLEPLPENFHDDLPASAWRVHLEGGTESEQNEGHAEEVAAPDAGRNKGPVTVMENCPLADEWRDMDRDLARLYCLVDPAKMEAFNPRYTLVHVSHTLCGDGCCRIALREKEPAHAGAAPR